MARNLRAKIPETDTLVIHDRNAEAATKFLQEVGISASSMGAEGKNINIEIASTPRGVAEKSVRPSRHVVCRRYFIHMMSMFYR